MRIIILIIIWNYSTRIPMSGCEVDGGKRRDDESENRTTTVASFCRWHYQELWNIITTFVVVSCPAYVISRVSDDDIRIKPGHLLATI